MFQDSLGYADGSTLPSILYVITDLDIGGVPLHLYHLARHVRASGYDVGVVSLAPAGAVGEMLATDGFDVESCEGRGGRDFRVIGRLADIFRRRKPDIVHALLFHANVASRWAAKRAGIAKDRVLCEIQTVEIERKWHLWVDWLTHRGCRLTVGNSPSVIEHLHRRAGIPRDRLRLVKGGIDPSRFDDVQPLPRGNIGLSDDDRLILWVGRLDPVKGLDHLIAAFASLRPEQHNAHLVLVGGGPLQLRLEAQIAALHLADRVHQLGPRQDVPQLLKTADIFAFPSRTEGLPNALLEAMAAGLPIVTTDVPGCRDLIRHDTNGLVVPFGDRDGLQASLHGLLTNGEQREELGAAARTSIEAEWNIAATYEAYLNAYREIVIG